MEMNMMKVYEQFDTKQLESKSIEELREMLADERLLAMDDTESNKMIFEIAEAIHAKEGKSEALLEAERVRFWAGLVARYGDKMPIKLDDVVRKRKASMVALSASSKHMRFSDHFQTHKHVRRFAIAAMIVVVILAGNAALAYAFNVNALQATVSFSDALFIKAFAPAEDVVNTPTPQIGSLAEFASFQEALTAFGITRPYAPKYLPAGFEFDTAQAMERPDYVKIAAQYLNGEKGVTITVTSYSTVPNGHLSSIEKSSGTPDIYSSFGIEFYIFANIDNIVATWVDGMTDCNIQGNVSTEEMKSIIDSMYIED
jgi:hypothetical protein